MREVTPEELAQALAAAPDDAHDWPYIDADADVIDGRLGLVAEWLAENFVITPRSPDWTAEAVTQRRAERKAENERKAQEWRAQWQHGHPLIPTANGLRRLP